jgi:glycine/D-amino acid oxidase-like deaminating enzyme
MTPDGTPIVGAHAAAQSVPQLTGHGTLGLDHVLQFGAVLADLVMSISSGHPGRPIKSAATARAA